MPRFEPLLHQKLTALRTRTHGDYHLEQVLYTGKDYVIIDFDGGGDVALTERRRKRSPLRDVAGMVRSFHFWDGISPAFSCGKSMPVARPNPDMSP